MCSGRNARNFLYPYIPARMLTNVRPVRTLTSTPAFDRSRGRRWDDRAAFGCAPSGQKIVPCHGDGLYKTLSNDYRSPETQKYRALGNLMLNCCASRRGPSPEIDERVSRNGRRSTPRRPKQQGSRPAMRASVGVWCSVSSVTNRQLI
jgi:hypothetical protein